MEIWKDIEGYEGLYQVSSLGRVKSLERIVPNSSNGFRKIKERIRKTPKASHGYANVTLSKGNKISVFLVHQLVAIAFLDHTPNKFELVVDHINDNKLDNRAENLQIVTNRFNSTKNPRGSSKYVGVSFDNSNKKWKSAIQINGENILLGNFDCELKAAEAYQKKLAEIE